MPVNRNALIRYTTLDNCLRNRHRKWTLEDLIDACSEALYEFEGIDKGVSKRTIQMDIQVMRSEKLGYNAPIVVDDKKYYSYENPEYSITNIPLTDQDLGKLSEVVDILKQFKGFTHFKDLGGMLQRLEDKIHTSKTHERSIIDLEKNDNLKGLEFIDPIYQAILHKHCIEITYQSFKARDENTFLFHPFLLKEHRNRWFVLGKRKKKENAIMLALDRVISISKNDTPIMETDDHKIATYFDNVIGVSVSEGLESQEVVFIASHENAPYIETKPLHHSQKLIKKTDEGVYFSILVQHNFELERDLLSFGDRIKVISPTRLRSSIKFRLNNAIDLYETELNEKTISNYPHILQQKGFIITNHVYTRKEIRNLGRIIQQYKEQHLELKNDNMFSIRRLFKELPKLEQICLNPNLKKILNQFGQNYFLTKAIYFDKPAQSNWYVTWHQDLPINVKVKHDTDGYTAWTKKKDVISVIPKEEILHNTITIRIHLDDAFETNGCLKIIPGSHKKTHSTNEKALIVNNSVSTPCEINKGGINIMKPLLLHSSSKSISQKPRRVIHLEFNSIELDGDLEWEERENCNL